MTNLKLSNKDAKKLIDMFDTVSYNCFIEDLQSNSTDGYTWADEMLDVLNKIQEQIQKAK